MTNAAVQSLIDSHKLPCHRAAGLLIRVHRMRAGMSQQDLAAAVHCSLQRFKRAERAIDPIAPVLLLDCLIACGVPADDARPAVHALTVDDYPGMMRELRGSLA